MDPYPSNGDEKEFRPNLYPQFPQGAKPVADPETFSLKKLQDGNISERARLGECCMTRGFFYLDFKGTTTDSLHQKAEKIGHLAEEVFKLPASEKLPFKQLEQSKPQSLLGYKVAGRTATDVYHTPDTAEFMNIGKDDILLTPTRTPVDLPPLITSPSNLQLLQSFATTSHATGLSIMALLAAHLSIPSDSFAPLHRIGKPSDDHIRLTRGPPRRTPDLPEIQTPGHTDFGTITILFNWMGGLQIWSEPSPGNKHFTQLFDGQQTEAGDAEWLWVRPKPNHAIVNLGDAAVKFSGGLLCSARHRVVPAPGEQGKWPRYSVVYFVRPEDGVVLRRFVGGKIPAVQQDEDGDQDSVTAADWIARQEAQLREGRSKPEKASMCRESRHKEPVA